MSRTGLVISAHALCATVRDALAAERVPAEIARVEAEIMVDADLCGVPSHGVLMLPRLLTALREGRAAPSPVTAVVSERGATCVFDGGNGPGRWVSLRAMDHAVARAQSFGIGACLAVRTTHWGRAHAYAAHAARQGYVGVCTTNAIPTLAPPGASRAALGNNPLAIAIPRMGESAHSEPLVLDMAMTQAALGKVGTYRREGLPIPPDWGLDAGGQATTDSSAILASGLLAPMGGHKGMGLALMMELLTAGLAGGLFGHEIVARDRSGIDPDSSKLFVAIDADAFGGGSRLQSRVDTLLAWIRESAPGTDLLAPGERGWRARERHLRDGVPIHAGIVEQLAAVGVTLRA